MGVTRIPRGRCSSTCSSMFYPAGEEPVFAHDDSEDDEYIFNGGIEETKKETKGLFTFENGMDDSNVTKENPFIKREYVFAQTSMMNEDFRLAVVKGDADKVIQMIDAGFDIECRLKGGWTPLMFACESGCNNIIQLLLNNGANPNSHKDSFTPLMCLSTCKNHYKEDELGCSAKLLIEKGARVNSRDRHCITSLMYACQVGHVTIIEVLLSSSAGVDYQDNRGFTALCYSALTGNDVIVNMLLNHGGNPKLSTHLGDTPSSLALAAGYSCLSDILDGRTTPSLTNNSISGNSRPAVVTADYSTNTSRQLGDMELFLAGLKLRHLEVVFQSHCVDFSRLLSLTDKDLDDMGITQLGVKRTLMDAITDLHKASWKMPDKPFEVRRGLSIQEYSSVLCQMAHHVNYVGASAAFLTNHTSNGLSPITMVTNEREQKELIEQIESVVEAGTRLEAEISSLKKQVYKGLGRQGVTRKRGLPVLKMIGYTFGAIVCGLLIHDIFAGKHFPLLHVYKPLSTIINRYTVM